MKFSQISDACVKCGKCIPVCTIHEENRDEITSPRGFLDLLAAYKEGSLELDKEAKKVFESCFLCTNCVEVCPSKLRVDNAIEEVRYDIAKKFGIAWYKKLIFFFLRRRKILDLVAKLGYVFQSCAFKIQNENENTGMKARFSMPFVKKGRLLTSFNKKSFLNSNPKFINNDGEKTIGFFVGCLANYFYIDTANAVLKIAKELKINVDLMKEQVCCGAPQFFTGDFKSVEVLAKKNIEYFEKKLEKLDAIIVPEATCSAMLKIDYEHFFIMQNDLDWAKRAKCVSSKIYMASEYFYKFTSLEEILKTNYHFVEMSNSNTCCGFGGVGMQTDYYDRALSVGLKKAQMIDESKASVVSAECSACRMQISNALEQNSSKVVFASPLELIAKAL